MTENSEIAQALLQIASEMKARNSLEDERNGILMKIKDELGCIGLILDAAQIIADGLEAK